MSAIPDALATPKRDQKGWRVTYAPPVRGACSTNRKAKVMAVPDEYDDTARAIRAHEMAHAAFSPMEGPEILAPLFGVSADALAAAEEARVNRLANAAGADVSALTDGTEKSAARVAALRNDYRAALLLTVSTMGTDAERHVKSALTKHAPKSWRKDLTAFRRTVKTALGHVPYIRNLTAYERDGVTMPEGFLYAVHVARALENYAEHGKSLPTDKQAKAQEGKATTRARDDYAQARKFTRHPEHTAEKSTYQDVRLMEPDMNTRHLGKIAKRRVAAPVGKKPRRMSRLMTDPHRRVFDRTIRTNGGVVVIDQSGSMHLAEADIDRVLAAAGGATVIGYSDIGRNLANVWVIAENGQRSTGYPRGGCNNGVDGSALNFAATKRRNKREPFIWITDGRAYDKAENFGPRASSEIHHTTKRYGIHVAENIDEAVRELQRCARGNTSPTKFSYWAESIYQEHKKNGEVD